MNTMRRSIGVVAFTLLLVAGVFLALPAFASSRRISKTRSHGGHHHASQPKPAIIGTTLNPESYKWARRPANMKRPGGPDTLQIAGSSLPDCSHACGSCFPCRLVMVSFVCATLEEAETCPMAYKCMCRNKSYPVP